MLFEDKKTNEGNDLSLVSVVTVTLNSAEALNKTIDSVVNQEYPYIEHIVVDGASSDGSLAILKRSELNKMRWVSEPDKGVYDAMNKGLLLTDPTSRYVTFLNAGDVFHDNRVVQEVVLFGHGHQTNIYGDIQKVQIQTNYPKRLNKFTLATGMVCHQAIFFNTSFHRRFPYDLKYEICADYKLLLEMLGGDTKFHKIDKILIDFDNTGISHTRREKLHKEKFEIRKKFPLLRFYRSIKLGVKKLR